MATLWLPQEPTQVLSISPAAPSSLEWHPVSQPDPSYSLSPSQSLKPWLTTTDPSTSAPAIQTQGTPSTPYPLRAKYTLLRKVVVSLREKLPSDSLPLSMSSRKMQRLPHVSMKFPSSNPQPSGFLIGFCTQSPGSRLSQIF